MEAHPPSTTSGGSEEAEDAPTADELDKELLAQLHAATLKAADSCFEIKKLCATVVIPTGTLVALLSDRRLNIAAFISTLLVVAFFWIADANGYYYQRKLRARMVAVWHDRAQRLKNGWRNAPDDRTVSAIRAAFNDSQWFYAILAAPILIGLALYLAGVIPSPSQNGQP